MEITQFYNPVRFVFGKDSINTLAKEINKYGKKCLLVAQDNNEAMVNIRNKITLQLNQGNIEFDLFNDIRPNPLISDINKGIELVKENNYDVIVAVGGGSVIDTAKILCVSNKMEINWENIFKESTILENKSKLPLFTIPTTAGTGSHCTQAAIISDDYGFKHSVYSYDFFSNIAFVDYTLTLSLPVSLTASTGFDAFCHLSESYINGRLSSLNEVLCLNSIKKILEILPKLVVENKIEYREIMSVADSCAGICLSNGGAIIPHAFGEAISSCMYRVNHGSSLALVYPAFVEYYFDNPIIGNRLKYIIKLMNYQNIRINNGKEARVIVESFIKSLTLKMKLSDYDVSPLETKAIKDILINQKKFNNKRDFEIIADICKQ